MNCDQNFFLFTCEEFSLVFRWICFCPSKKTHFDTLQFTIWKSLKFHKNFEFSTKTLYQKLNRMFITLISLTKILFHHLITLKTASWARLNYVYFHTWATHIDLKQSNIMDWKWCVLRDNQSTNESDPFTTSLMMLDMNLVFFCFEVKNVQTCFEKHVVVIAYPTFIVYFACKITRPYS